MVVTAMAVDGELEIEICLEIAVDVGRSGGKGALPTMETDGAQVVAVEVRRCKLRRRPFDDDARLGEAREGFGRQQRHLDAAIRQDLQRAQGLEPLEGSADRHRTRD